MGNKRSKAHIKKNLSLPPEDWQEAMERGVFLLNEHNREFVEYESPVVHLPDLSPIQMIIQNVLVVGLAVFAIGWIYSLVADLTRSPRGGGIEPISGWWFVVAIAIVILGAITYTTYRVSKELQRKLSFVLEGHLIFVPIIQCTVMSHLLRDVKVYLVYDFTSPTTNEPLFGRFVGNPIGTQWCPAKGMVAAVLYKSDKEYQAL